MSSNYRDLIVWQLSMDLANRIGRMLNGLISKKSGNRTPESGNSKGEKQ